MATSTSASEDNRRNQVLVGELPQDFLRVGATPQQQQVAADYMTAQMLQAQQAGVTFVTGNTPRLSITIVEAKLTKNYGIVKMDPYCRVRIGHAVLETQTAHSGSKTPRWNKTLYCYLPTGVDSFYLEIFDERAFTMDDRVAWTHISIPSRVFSGETSDDWYPLSGKQGEEKEGVIHLVLSYTEQPPPMPQQQVVYAQGMQPVVMVPAAQPAFYPVQQVQQGVPPAQPQQNHGPPRPLYTEEDVKQMKDVFPNVEEDVIKTVLESNRGNKDRTINQLLQMNT